MASVPSSAVTPLYTNTSSPYDSRQGGVLPKVDLTNSGIAFLIGLLVVFNAAGSVMTFCVLLMRMMKESKAMSILLLSLTIADISTSLFITIPFLLLFATGSYILGSIACKLNFGITILVTNASILTHLLIGIERYHSVRKPTPAKSNIRRIYISLAAAWIFSLFCVIPYVFIYKLQQIQEHQICTLDFEIDRNRPALVDAIAYLSIILLIPFIVLIFCYAGVLYYMKQSMRRVAGGMFTGVSQSRKGRSVAIMCILVVVLYAIRIVPEQITFIIVLGEPTLKNNRIFTTFSIVYVALGGLNPIIYGIMWQSFRNHALSVNIF